MILLYILLTYMNASLTEKENAESEGQRSVFRRWGYRLHALYGDSL